MTFVVLIKPGKRDGFFLWNWRLPVPQDLCSADVGALLLFTVLFIYFQFQRDDTRDYLRFRVTRGNAGSWLFLKVKYYSSDDGHKVISLYNRPADLK